MEKHPVFLDKRLNSVHGWKQGLSNKPQKHRPPAPQGCLRPATWLTWGRGSDQLSIHRPGRLPALQQRDQVWLRRTASCTQEETRGLSHPGRSRTDNQLPGLDGRVFYYSKAQEEKWRVSMMKKVVPLSCLQTFNFQLCKHHTLMKQE